MLKKIVRYVLLALAALLAVLLVVAATLILEWPWWVGLFLVLGLVGLVCGGFFVRKIWLRSREDKFVDDVIRQDEARVKSLAAAEADNTRELQVRWKEAIDRLKRSHLRKAGNPLYALPWYMIIGESGSGKTTAIRSARLTSSFDEINKVSGVSGTRNCDWWFFEQAILLDTAGRYAIHVNEEQDKEEWKKFLSLLSRYRKREPLNGLIVTIAADKLLGSNPEALGEEGRVIRARIDELMLALGAKFPVYVLVTKCDLIQGMTKFCDHLPEKTLEQGMGCLRRDLAKNIAAFTGQAIDSVTEGLRSLRLLLLHETREETVDPALLMFPEEFGKLKEGLDAFMKRAFQETPYQETPILRGMFFSSGRQEGLPYSHFLNSLGLLAEKEVLPGTSKGLFLHDFFAMVLPRDRSLFAPTQKALAWGQLTRNLGLASYLALALALCGLLSFSFVKNLRAMRASSGDQLRTPVLAGQLLNDMDRMDRYRTAIQQVELKNQGWWIPRFGLNTSLTLEESLKNRYVERFRQGIIGPLDQKMATRIKGFSGQSPAPVIGSHIIHLVERVQYLKKYAAGDASGLAKAPPLFDEVLLHTERADSQPAAGDLLFSLYETNLRWNPERVGVNDEISELQQRLRYLLQMNGGDLRWLVAWAEEQPDLAGVALQDFWGSGAAAGVKVSPAFTARGKELIDGFMRQIEETLADPAASSSPFNKTDFDSWYRNEYVDAWKEFAKAFPEGQNGLGNAVQHRQMAQRMAGADSPYFSLLNRMVRELEPLFERGNLPSWVNELRFYQVISQPPGAGTSATASEGVSEKSKELLRNLRERFASGQQGFTPEKPQQTVEAYQKYRQALEEVAAMTASRKTSYQLAVQGFSENPVTSSSPVYTANKALGRVLSYLGPVPSRDNPVLILLQGPLRFLWNFVCADTACFLQEQWEQELLAEVQGISDQQTVQQLLFDQGGLARKFVSGPAAPFLGRNVKGFYPTSALDSTLPFDATFLSFLSKGSVSRPTARANFPVVIEGLPTTANAGARIQPHATHLEMQCANSASRLDNYNFPIRQTFAWSPRECGDIVLQIEVGNLLLVKKYDGDNAFPKFLQEFQGGKRSFTPKDFPEQSDALNSLNINSILVSYRFTGQQPVLQMLNTNQQAIPYRIVECRLQ